MKFRTSGKFQLLEENIATFMKNELKTFQMILTSDSSESLENLKQDEMVLGRVKIRSRAAERHSEACPEVSDKNGAGGAHYYLRGRTLVVGCSLKLKSKLRNSFCSAFEGMLNSALLNEIYSQLYITEQGTAKVKDDHEIRQIESRRADRPEKTIQHEEMFTASSGREEPGRTVMTKGVAGIVKTFLTQKFTLDWAKKQSKSGHGLHFLIHF
ncbi:hypothetical protein ILYODFUR_017494 [Ilyodon furcidens]|uniref:FISNA domain-containing protein n=1 Tax=Ilyodon furcidens TaxID=33524 RepID=A0ABV0USU0_9TELE